LLCGNSIVPNFNDDSIPNLSSRIYSILRTQPEKIHEGLKINDSLKAVKYGVDGEIDLNTVDGLVRSMALAIILLSKREVSQKPMMLRYQDR
jgi:hypothetical protein